MATAHLGVDDRIWLTVSLMLTVATHFLNRRSRLTVDRAVAPLRVPERMLGYGANQLSVFVVKATNLLTESRQTVLDLYRGKVLPIDLGFAVALGLFSALLWTLIAPHLPTHPFFAWVSWIGWSASFLYLIFDMAEDIALFLLLRPDRQIRNGQASIASTFTVGKMISITGSLFGLGVFAFLAAVDWIIERSE
jgi:hypothetical protein